MNVFKRQIIKGSTANFLGIGLGVLNNIWIFPLAFSLEELGVYRWVERTAVLVAAIALLGMHRMYVRFQSRFTEDLAHQFLSNTLYLVASIATVVGLLMTFFAPALAHLLGAATQAPEIRTLGAVIAGSMTYTLGLSVASSAKRISVTFFFKNVGIRLTVLLGAYAVSLGKVDFSYWMRLFAYAHLFVGVLVLAYALRLKGWKAMLPKSLGEEMTKELVTFASSGILMAIMTMSLATIDSQMIASLMSYEALGIYSIAFFIGSFVDGIRRPVSQALSPQFANLWNDHNIEAIGATYARTSRVLMTVALLSFVAIVPNLDFIFSLIPDPERFEAAKPVVALILLSRVIDYSFGSNGEILSNGPHFKWNLFAITGLVAALIGLNFVLIPRFGLEGAGYSLIIAYAIFNTVKALYLYKKEGIQPFSRVQFHLLLLAAITLVATYFSDSALDGADLAKFLVRNLIIAATTLFGFLTLKSKI